MARRAPVLAFVILLGAAVGSTTFAYTVLTSPPIPGTTAPTVVLGTPATDGNLTVVDVVRSDPPRPLRELSASIARNGITQGTLGPLDEGFSPSFDFSDRDLDRRLTAGDRFMSFLLQPGQYELRLSWRDVLVAAAFWDVVPPSVAFSPAQTADPMITVDVAYAAPDAPLWDFRAILFEDGATLAMINPLSAFVAPRFEFADWDNDSRLSAGDRFTTWWNASGVYTLSLEWQGIQVANTTWTIVAPNVTYAVTVVGPSTSWANVTESAPPRPCGEFWARIEVNGSYVDSVSDLCDNPGVNGILSAQDRDGDGLLSVGDRLVVEAGPGALFDLWVYWRMGLLVRYAWSN